ncbi:Calycin [Cinara cedri]|uniref:Calycin n=1 Tax=Cinara cedri TaxID=506608 RepID=A0A5E4MUU5_9HEMI|nr:Calycin [Cinara cedri]
MYHVKNTNRLFQAVCAYYCLALASSAGHEKYRYCENLNPQNAISINLTTGIWYMIVVYNHRIKGEPMGQLLSVCPSINLTYANEHTDTELNFLWKETVSSIEYQFKIIDITSPGTWMSIGEQKGSVLALDNFKNFTGKVFVKKAVKDHMWLTFCSPDTYLYSLVLSRGERLRPRVMEGINKLISMQQFPVSDQIWTSCGR